MNKKEFKQSGMREKKELLKNKRMYGQFVRQIPETTDEKETWNWLRKADLEVETKPYCMLRKNRQFQQTM